MNRRDLDYLESRFVIGGIPSCEDMIKVCLKWKLVNSRARQYLLATAWEPAAGNGEYRGDDPSQQLLRTYLTFTGRPWSRSSLLDHADLAAWVWAHISKHERFDNGIMFPVARVRINGIYVVLTSIRCADDDEIPACEFCQDKDDEDKDTCNGCYGSCMKPGVFFVGEIK